MIDLHSHILPDIDDGATSLQMAVAMARMAVEDGVTVMACTPHFMPGRYDTTVEMLADSIRSLKNELKRQAVPLTLVPGGDLHIRPDMTILLQAKKLPCIGKSRYLLLEPSHHLKPPGLETLCRKLLSSGYRPILTHPERLSWIENHYDGICGLDEMGVAIQITAGSITGRFGHRVQDWSERMFRENRVDIVASDAHNLSTRSPGLSRCRATVVDWMGEATARRIIDENPRRILKDLPLIARKPEPMAVKRRDIGSKLGFWS